MHEFEIEIIGGRADADGEGVYPHSYERLGVQHGYHSTVVLFDPSPGSTTARNVTLQVACARKQKHVTPPHKTVYVNPGETKTAEYTKLNPRQKVPLLQDGDFCIGESAAIVAYLSRMYSTPERSLIPEAPRE